MQNDERLRKLTEIERVSSPEDVDVLIEALKSDDVLIREAAFDKLKQFKFPQVPVKVAKLFKDSEAYVRNAAVLLMAEMWDLSKEELTKLLHDPDKDVRKLALDSLHYVVGDPSVEDLFAFGLDDVDVNNVIAAVEYLGELQSKKYTDRILKLLAEGDNEFLLATCIRALSKMADERIAERVVQLFPELERIDDITLMAYLRFLASFPRTLKNLNTLIDLAEKKWDIALKEFLDLFAAILDTTELSAEQKDRMFEFLRRIFASDIPSPNKYEVLLLMARLNPDHVKREIVNYLYSNDPMIQLAAVELIDQFSWVDYLDDLKHICASAEDEDLRAAAELVIERFENVERE